MRKYGGEVQTTTVMKTINQLCPWQTEQDLLNYTNEYFTSYQKLMGCKCPTSSACNGFCTFPVSGVLNRCAGISWNKTGNQNYQIVSGIPTTFNCQLIANTDIQVADDLEIYFVDNAQIVKSITEIEAAEKSFSTLKYNLSAIFQGFGNFNGETQLNPEYLAVNNAVKTNNKFYIDGLEIPENCPFNYKHIIKSGTKLTGLDWKTKQISNVLKSDQSVIFKVKSWFSDTVYCTGDIKFKVISLDDESNILPQVLSAVSYYDFVERNKGFFKYQQENLHKSNIYSIKLTNTRLNPANDKQLNKYYNLYSFVNHLLIELKNSFIETQNNQYILIFNGLKFTDVTYDYNKNIFIFVNYDTDINSDNGFSLFSLNDVATILNYKIVYNISEEFQEAYNIDDEKEIVKENTIKNDMRKILETAIRNSVQEYMPADTTLWKIIYSGL